MAYGGMLGILYERGSEKKNVDINKVKMAFDELCNYNQMLSRYNSRQKLEQVVEFHIRESNQHFRVNDHWKNHILMPPDSVDPNASEHEFYELIIGHDGSNVIRMNYPALMSLLFPYLFANGTGHYSLIDKHSKPLVDTNGEIIPEERGGNADASRWLTLTAYLKLQLMNKDRRFGYDPSFLFWSYDIREKCNIHSANRHSVRSSGKQLRKDDIMDEAGVYNKDRVTIVPHIIRSSYAYKRKHYLDLKTMCDRLGPPQLFMTFSCDDLSDDMKKATGLSDPWNDPVLFATHFKRQHDPQIQRWSLSKVYAFRKSLGVFANNCL